MRESFREEITRMKREQGERIGRVVRALKQSPAVIVTRGGRRTLYILSGEMSTPEDGAWRLTEFGEDGPYGHNVDHTIPKLAERIHFDDIRPASDEEVMAWTTAPAFIDGTKRVAITQGINTLSYQARTDAQRAAFRDMHTRVHEALARDDVDRALEIVTAAIGDQGSLTPNPAWSTHAIAISYDLIEEKVPPAWLPKLAAPRPGPRDTMMVELREFGCGAFGCVLPTLSPDVVLKVTTDTTEAEFAAGLAASLVAPICVEYHMVIGLAAKHDGRKIFLLWREAADHVGDLGGRKLDPHRYAETYISAQWDAAQLVLESIHNGASMAVRDRMIGAWLERVDQMAHQRKVPELVPLAEGLLQVWHDQRIFIGDIHAGNIGMVHRESGDAWVITDPGHVAVFEPA